MATIASQVSQWNSTYIYVPGQVVSYIGSSASISSYGINNGYSSVIGVPPITSVGVLNTGWTTLGGGGGSGGITNIITTSPSYSSQIIINSSVNPMQVSEKATLVGIGVSSTPVINLVGRTACISTEPYISSLKNFLNCFVLLSPRSSVPVPENITLLVYNTQAWTYTGVYAIGNIVIVTPDIFTTTYLAMYKAIGTPVVGLSPDLDSNWVQCLPTDVGSPYSPQQCGTRTITIPAGTYPANTTIQLDFTSVIQSQYPIGTPSAFSAYVSSSVTVSLVDLTTPLNTPLITFPTA